jgi:hypothetical protein
MAQTIRNGKVTPWVYDTVKETPIPSISSVSVTALGLTGETLKGPAFEIVNVGNWTEYKQYFGGTSTEKFKSNNFPKYCLYSVQLPTFTISNAGPFNVSPVKPSAVTDTLLIDGIGVSFTVS